MVVISSFIHFNFYDSKSALLFMRIFVRVKVIVVDRGYTGDIVEDIKNRFGDIMDQVQNLGA